MASVDSTVTLVDVEFVGNGATATYLGNRVAGGGLYDENTSTTMERVRFEGNRLLGAGFARRGAGYAAVGGGFTGSLTEVTFVGNNAAMDSAGTAAGVGMYAALSAGATGASVELTDVVFERNSGAPHGRGAGLNVQGMPAKLSRVSFIGNSMSGATSADVLGGGMYFFNDPGAGAADLTDVQFVGNQAVRSSPDLGGASGGGLYVDGDLVASRSDFVGNSVDAATFANGGGLYFQGGSSGQAVSLTSVSFVGNSVTGHGTASAEAYGGGLFASTEEGTAAMTSVTFAENRVTADFDANGSGMFMVGNCGAGACAFSNLAFGGNTGPVGASELDTDAEPASLTIGPYCGTTDPGYGANFTAVGSYSDQFDFAASGHAFLSATSVCRDAGDNTAADAAFGAAVWPTLTSQIDASEDTGTVDHGRLYDRSGLWITSFEAPDDMTLTWEVLAPAGTQCVVKGSNLTREVPSADTASGSLEHTQPAGLFQLTCRSGGLVAEAEISTE